MPEAAFQICTPAVPPLRPHLGQHSPAGMNGLWSPGQVSAGQGRALQDTLPLEQTHTEQGWGLHWLSSCGEEQRKTHRETDSYTHKYNQEGGSGETVG